MKIGIDIDGVLTNLDAFHFDYFSKFCVENNIDYNIQNSYYDISKTYGLGEEREKEFWNEYLFNYAKTEKIRPFASDIISKLKKEGNEIYIITARYFTNKNSFIGEKMREIVTGWLKQNNVYYDKLIFSKAEKERKSTEIIENKIDIMIEDNPNNIKELSSVTKVICYNTSYNKDCAGKNIIRCYSWYDIYKQINSLKNSK